MSASGSTPGAGGTGAGVPARDARGARGGAPGRYARPSTPRRVRGGLRLPVREGAVTAGALSTPLVALLQHAIDPGEFEQGLEYARLGQVAALDVRAGSVVATVQGREARPYETSLVFGAYTEPEWEHIVQALADEARHLVSLLDEALPEAIPALLAALGRPLLPPDSKGFVMSCTCVRGSACRHAAAVGLLLAEDLAARPLRVFALRGLPAEQLLERVRQARAIRAHGVATAHFDPLIPESRSEAAPLETCIEEFWRSPTRLPRDQGPTPGSVSHALLRRLGPSPLKGRFPLVGLLASIYDRVAARAAEISERESS